MVFNHIISCFKLEIICFLCYAFFEVRTLTREEFIKSLIKERGFNIKSFAAHIGIPYTSLLSMLNNSIGGAAVETVIKICEELNIPVEALKSENFNSSLASKKAKLNNNEQELIKKYRLLTDEQQGAVNANINYFIELNKSKNEENIN